MQQPNYHSRKITADLRFLFALIPPLLPKAYQMGVILNIKLKSTIDQLIYIVKITLNTIQVCRCRIYPDNNVQLHSAKGNHRGRQKYYYKENSPMFTCRRFLPEMEEGKDYFVGHNYSIGDCNVCRVA